MRTVSKGRFGPCDFYRILAIIFEPKHLFMSFLIVQVKMDGVKIGLVGAGLHLANELDREYLGEGVSLAPHED